MRTRRSAATRGSTWAGSSRGRHTWAPSGAARPAPTSTRVQRATTRSGCARTGRCLRRRRRGRPHCPTQALRRHHRARAGPTRSRTSPASNRSTRAGARCPAQSGGRSMRRSSAASPTRWGTPTRACAARLSRVAAAASSPCADAPTTTARAWSKTAGFAHARRRRRRRHPPPSRASVATRRCSAAATTTGSRAGRMWVRRTRVVAAVLPRVARPPGRSNQLAGMWRRGASAAACTPRSASCSLSLSLAACLAPCLALPHSLLSLAPSRPAQPPPLMPPRPRIFAHSHGILTPLPQTVRMLQEARPPIRHVQAAASARSALRVGRHVGMPGGAAALTAAAHGDVAERREHA